MTVRIECSDMHSTKKEIGGIPLLHPGEIPVQRLDQIRRETGLDTQYLTFQVHPGCLDCSSQGLVKLKHLDQHLAAGVLAVRDGGTKVHMCCAINASICDRTQCPSR